MALVAQAVREATSKQTSEALAGGQEPRGRVGNPHWGDAALAGWQGQCPTPCGHCPQRRRHAQNLAPMVADIQAGGATNLRAIASELNARGHTHPARSVARVDGDEPALTGSRRHAAPASR